MSGQLIFPQQDLIVCLSYAVSDPGSGVSEAAAGNCAAKENSGGEGGTTFVQPSAPRGIPNSGSVAPNLGAEVGDGFVWGWLMAACSHCLLGRSQRCAVSPSPCRTELQAGRARSQPCWTLVQRSQPAPPRLSQSPALAPSPASCANGTGKSITSWETPHLLSMGLGQSGQGSGGTAGLG